MNSKEHGYVAVDMATGKYVKGFLAHLRANDKALRTEGVQLRSLKLSSEHGIDAARASLRDKRESFLTSKWESADFFTSETWKYLHLFPFAQKEIGVSGRRAVRSEAGVIRLL